MISICDAMEEMIELYVDGELSDNEREIVNSHAQVCKQCQKRLNERKLLDWNMRYDNPIKVPYEHLELVRNQALDRFLMEQSSLTSSAHSSSPNSEKKGVRAKEINKQIIRNMTRFIDYIPGKKNGSKLVKQAGEIFVKSVKKKAPMQAKGVMRRLIGV